MACSAWYGLVLGKSAEGWWRIRVEMACLPREEDYHGHIQLQLVHEQGTRQPEGEAHRCFHVHDPWIPGHT
jgi:hypothetical protein